MSGNDDEAKGLHDSLATVAARMLGQRGGRIGGKATGARKRRSKEHYSRIGKLGAAALKAKKSRVTDDT